MQEIQTARSNSQESEAKPIRTRASERESDLEEFRSSELFIRAAGVSAVANDWFVLVV